MAVLYLAYGSNMLPRRIEKRLGPCRLLGAANVSGFSLRFHKRGRDGSGKCDAFFTEHHADTLHGVVYELSEAQRTSLDAFEGSGYTTRTLSVDAAFGSLEVYTYVARPEHVDHALRPFPWYKSIVVAGALAHDLPQRYIERLRAIETIADEDAQRAALHLALLDDERSSRGGEDR